MQDRNVASRKHFQIMKRNWTAVCALDWPPPDIEEEIVISIRNSESLARREKWWALAEEGKVGHIENLLRIF